MPASPRQRRLGRACLGGPHERESGSQFSRWGAPTGEPQKTSRPPPAGPIIATCCELFRRWDELQAPRTSDPVPPSVAQNCVRTTQPELPGASLATLAWASPWTGVPGQPPASWPQPQPSRPVPAAGYASPRRGHSPPSPSPQTVMTVPHRGAVAAGTALRLQDSCPLHSASTQLSGVLPRQHTP